MDGEKKRVLVVDDDADIQQVVKILLRRAGLDIVSAETARAAQTILGAGPPPDLVILDLMMPEVSGLDFLRQMRADGSFKHLPVLVLSALIESDDIREALTAGADRYLTKPYIANNLVSIVQEMIRAGRIPPKTGTLSLS